MERGCLIPDGVEPVVLDHLGGLALLAVGRHTVHGHDHIRVDYLALLSPARLGELSTAHRLKQAAAAVAAAAAEKGSKHETNGRSTAWHSGFCVWQGKLAAR